ncbi:MAG: beta-lactamase family protein [Brachybacterium sp.]|uniref:serine hydrolase domain-containing protein n=1 Tax=Brachybacterium sp. TaxID=1891286 RepID=UPI002649EF34|nr:serine hydrolase domain-containing protein [Brachybacterium sp.]MDN5688337.1 beta-lactamase family protein [Brachybacterium sp.]
MTTAPAPPAMPREAVLDVAAWLPQWLETARHLRQQSGLQAAIWHDGELVAEVAVGEADLDAGIALRPTHRLRIASHSKMVTAMTLMRLREQGRLRLDDTLGDHLGELAGAPVADRTLRDLLSHSAGLTRDSDDARWWRLGAPFPDRAQLLEIARTGAVKAEAGVHLQYSNIGYGLLGLVIEAVTGSSFAEAVDELVLAPVGVDGIGADLPVGAAGPEAADGFAAGHTSLLHGPRRPVEQVPTRALAAATGFWADAGAIATFAGRTLTAGELLSAASVREMRRRVWTLQDGRHYGLGLQEGHLHGFTVVGHSGGFPTGLSRTWAAPAERLVISVIGTAVDAPSSELAAGVLGLLALAAGRPAPQAETWEQPGAQGGGSDGRPRPAVLSRQPSVEVAGTASPLSATEVAGIVAGTYDGLWGRTRLAVLGGRLFALDEAAADPAASALELAVGDVRADPIVPGAETVELATWGDTGYDTWAEPLLARLGTPDEGGTLRCTALVRTGQVETPSADFTMPQRVTAP